MSPIFGIHNHAEVRPVDEGCPICEQIRALEAECAALKARIVKLEKFQLAISNAWAVASATTRPGATFMFGQKLRRLVREALEEYRAKKEAPQ
jgi:hypothetical protein